MARSACFPRVSFQFARAVLLGASVSSLLLGGCDSPTGKADRTVTEQVQDAEAKMAMGQADAAQQELETAARETTASLPVRLRAKALSADSELHTAQALSQKAEINDVKIDQLLRDIGLLAGEIDINNRAVAGLQKKEPTSVQAAVAQRQADIKGSDERPDWYKSPDTALPSLSADDKQAASLQGQISQLQDSIKSESDQRNQLLDQADKLSEQSNHEQKQKSVDLYAQSSNLRKQAADLTVKLDQDNLALGRAQADLAIRQGQHEALSGAIKNLDDKGSFFAQDWKDVQKEIDALNTGSDFSSKKIFGQDPLEPPKLDPKTGDFIKPAEATDENTIGYKAAQVAELVKVNHELRGRAETNFNNAIGFYKDAVGLAQQVQKDLSDRTSKMANPQESPDYMAFDQEKKALDPANYRFAQANAELQKAEFFARAAAEEKARLELDDRIKPILAGAGLTVLPTLDDSDGAIANDLKKSQDSARDAYQNSTELLGNIATGPASDPAEHAAAQVLQIYAQYGWSSLENSADDAQKASDHLSLARNAVSAAIADNAALPTLPAELAQVQPATPGR